MPGVLCGVDIGGTKCSMALIDEEGNEILCEILFTFESKEFNKNYVLFYPVAGEEDDIEVMAASYLPGEEGDGELQAIETDEEWDMIEKVLDQFEEDNEEVVAELFNGVVVD